MDTQTLTKALRLLGLGEVEGAGGVCACVEVCVHMYIITVVYLVEQAE